MNLPQDMIGLPMLRLALTAGTLMLVTACSSSSSSSSGNQADAARCSWTGTYTVNVVRTATGEQFSVDPIIRNGEGQGKGN